MLETDRATNSILSLPISQAINGHRVGRLAKSSIPILDFDITTRFQTWNKTCYPHSVIPGALERIWRAGQ